jgi:hypothetical protein
MTKKQTAHFPSFSNHPRIDIKEQLPVPYYYSSPQKKRYFQKKLKVVLQSTKTNFIVKIR